MSTQRDEEEASSIASTVLVSEQGNDGEGAQSGQVRAASPPPLPQTLPLTGRSSPTEVVKELRRADNVVVLTKPLVKIVGLIDTIETDDDLKGARNEDQIAVLRTSRQQLVTELSAVRDEINGNYELEKFVAEADINAEIRAKADKTRLTAQLAQERDTRAELKVNADQISVDVEDGTRRLNLDQQVNLEKLNALIDVVDRRIDDLVEKLQRVNIELNGLKSAAAQRKTRAEEINRKSEALWYGKKSYERLLEIKIDDIDTEIQRLRGIAEVPKVISVNDGETTTVPFEYSIDVPSNTNAFTWRQSLSFDNAEYLNRLRDEVLRIAIVGPDSPAALSMIQTVRLYHELYNATENNKPDDIGKPIDDAKLFLLSTLEQLASSDNLSSKIRDIVGAHVDVPREYKRFVKKDRDGNETLESDEDVLYRGLLGLTESWDDSDIFERADEQVQRVPRIDVGVTLESRDVEGVLRPGSADNKALPLNTSLERRERITINNASPLIDATWIYRIEVLDAENKVVAQKEAKFKIHVFNRCLRTGGVYREATNTWGSAVWLQLPNSRELEVLQAASQDKLTITMDDARAQFPSMDYYLQKYPLQEFLDIMSGKKDLADGQKIPDGQFTEVTLQALRLMSDRCFSLPRRLAAVEVDYATWMNQEAQVNRYAPFEPLKITDTDVFTSGTDVENERRATHVNVWWRSRYGQKVFDMVQDRVNEDELTRAWFQGAIPMFENVEATLQKSVSAKKDVNRDAYREYAKVIFTSRIRSSKCMAHNFIRYLNGTLRRRYGSMFSDLEITSGTLAPHISTGLDFGSDGFNAHLFTVELNLVERVMEILAKYGLSPPERDTEFVNAGEWATVVRDRMTVPRIVSGTRAGALRYGKNNKGSLFLAGPAFGTIGLLASAPEVTRGSNDRVIRAVADLRSHFGSTANIWVDRHSSTDAHPHPFGDPARPWARNSLLIDPSGRGLIGKKVSEAGLWRTDLVLADIDESGNQRKPLKFSINGRQERPPKAVSLADTNPAAFDALKQRNVKDASKKLVHSATLDFAALLLQASVGVTEEDDDGGSGGDMESAAAGLAMEKVGDSGRNKIRRRPLPTADIAPLKKSNLTTYHEKASAKAKQPSIVASATDLEKQILRYKELGERDIDNVRTDFNNLVLIAREMQNLLLLCNSVYNEALAQGGRGDVTETTRKDLERMLTRLNAQGSDIQDQTRLGMSKSREIVDLQRQLDDSRTELEQSQKIIEQLQGRLDAQTRIANTDEPTTVDYDSDDDTTEIPSAPSTSGTVRETEDEINLRADFERARAESDSLKERIAELEDQLRAANSDLNGLTETETVALTKFGNELKDNRDNFETLSEEYRELEYENNALRQDLETERERVRKLEDDLEKTEVLQRRDGKAYQNELDRINADEAARAAADAHDLQRQYERETQQKEERLRDIEKALELREREIAAREAELERQAEDAARLAAQKRDRDSELARKLEEAERRAREQKEEDAETQRYLEEQIRKREQCAQEQLARFESLLSDVEASSREKVRVLTADHRNEIADIVRRHNNALEALRTKLSDSSEQYNLLLGDFDDYKTLSASEKTALQNELAGLRSTISSIERQAQFAKEQLEADLIEARRDYEKEVAYLQQKHSTELDAVRKTLATEKDMSDNTISELRTRINDLQRELGQAETDCAREIREEIEKYKAAVDRMAEAARNREADVRQTQEAHRQRNRIEASNVSAEEFAGALTTLAGALNGPSIIQEITLGEIGSSPSLSELVTKRAANHALVSLQIDLTERVESGPLTTAVSWLAGKTRDEHQRMSDAMTAYTQLERTAKKLERVDANDRSDALNDVLTKWSQDANTLRGFVYDNIRLSVYQLIIYQKAIALRRQGTFTSVFAFTSDDGTATPFGKLCDALDREYQTRDINIEVVKNAVNAATASNANGASQSLTGLLDNTNFSLSLSSTNPGDAVLARLSSKLVSERSEFGSIHATIRKDLECIRNYADDCLETINEAAKGALATSRAVDDKDLTDDEQRVITNATDAVLKQVSNLQDSVQKAIDLSSGVIQARDSNVSDAEALASQVASPEQIEDSFQEVEQNADNLVRTLREEQDRVERIAGVRADDYKAGQATRMRHAIQVVTLLQNWVAAMGTRVLSLFSDIKLGQDSPSALIAAVHANLKSKPTGDVIAESTRRAFDGVDVEDIDPELVDDLTTTFPREINEVTAKLGKTLDGISDARDTDDGISNAKSFLDRFSQRTNDALGGLLSESMAQLGRLEEKAQSEIDRFQGKLDTRASKSDINMAAYISDILNHVPSEFHIKDAGLAIEGITKELLEEDHSLKDRYEQYTRLIDLYKTLNEESFDEMLEFEIDSNLQYTDFIEAVQRAENALNDWWKDVSPNTGLVSIQRKLNLVQRAQDSLNVVIRAVEDPTAMQRNEE